MTFNDEDWKKQLSWLRQGKKGKQGMNDLERKLHKQGTTTSSPRRATIRTLTVFFYGKSWCPSNEWVKRTYTLGKHTHTQHSYNAHTDARPCADTRITAWLASLSKPTFLLIGARSIEPVGYPSCALTPTVYVRSQCYEGVTPLLL